MAAAVARKESDLPAFKLTENVYVRRISKRRLQAGFLDVSKSGIE